MNLKTWLTLEKTDLDKRIRNYSKFRLLLLLSIIFGFFVSVFWLWQKTFSLKVKTFDNAVMVLISQLPTTGLREFFSLATHLGGGFWIMIMFVALLAFLLFKKKKRAAAVVTFTSAGSALFVFLLKNFFGRQRPSGCLPLEDCLAFPSGHATISFYFYGLLDYLIFRFLPIRLKAYLTISFLIGLLVLLIIISRLFLGLHYFSDILGGFFLGGTWLLLAILLIDFLY